MSFVAAWCVTLAACAVGPDYSRPAIDVGAAYREQQNETPGWKPAEPRAEVPRGRWWRLYDDAVLDGLMAQLNVANQSVAQSEANYRQAQALVQAARASLWPSATASVSQTRAGGAQSGAANAVGDRYNLSGTVTSWEVDLWGRLRRTVESNEAAAQGSAADLAAAYLSAQAALAQNYFQLRVLDEEKRLLEATVQAYQKSLQLTQHRYEVGVAAKADVAVASTQLENTRAQWVDLDWRRGQYEHAIAALIGVAPSKFTLAPTPFVQTVPQIPVGLPADLLERRPDVAAAERRAAAANARIGVAQAAYFPQLTLSATGGFSSGQFSQWLTAPARFWSLGPTLATAFFDGGARQAQLAQARATFDAQAAAYRQSVLTALREVEDYLIQLHVLGQEQTVQQRALEAARESLRLTRNQYKEGLIDYLNVATVETTALSAERSAITLIGTRLVASVQLIAALGGGWD
jgi:NodT family efflux transporter outer membrane factor (OMF) lipoprotein